MTTLTRLQQWKDAGIITSAQHETISAIVRKDRFSVFIELNALLYLGVLSFVAGVGWVIQTYFASLGDAAILSGLSLLLCFSFYYCFSRALPFSTAKVESPNPAFDYVLYLACLVFVLELGYLESRFQVLRNNWDYYLLFSSLLFFALAYRFDNRFVLSLALSTLAGWFGVRISQFNLSYGGSLRPYALAYGIVVAAAGIWLRQRDIKRHFTETYLHIAANVLFIALLSGVFDNDGAWFYLAGLLALSIIAAVCGVRFGRFAFVAYATAYGYIGISAEVLRGVRIDSAPALAYLVISGAAVILAMVLLARRFAREE